MIPPPLFPLFVPTSFELHGILERGLSLPPLEVSDFSSLYPPSQVEHRETDSLSPSRLWKVLHGCFFFHFSTEFFLFLKSGLTSSFLRVPLFLCTDASLGFNYPLAHLVKPGFLPSFFTSMISFCSLISAGVSSPPCLPDHRQSPVFFRHLLDHPFHQSLR